MFRRACRTTDKSGFPNPVCFYVICVQERFLKMENELETFYPKSREDWREWLQENHDKRQSVWLIYFKKKSSIPSVVYSSPPSESL